MNYGPCISRFDESYLASFNKYGETNWKFELPITSVNSLSYINRIIKRPSHLDLIISDRLKVPFHASRKAWCMANKDKTIREKIEGFNKREVSDFDKAAYPPNNGSDTTAFVVDYNPPSYRISKLSFSGKLLEGSEKLFDAKDYGYLTDVKYQDDDTLVILSRKDRSLYIQKYKKGKINLVAEFSDILYHPRDGLASLSVLPNKSIILSVLTSYKNLRIISIN